MICSSRKDMEGKLPKIRILDDSNPQKPVVRMANLCVASSHTVRHLFLLMMNEENSLLLVSPLYLSTMLHISSGIIYLSIIVRSSMEEVNIFAFFSLTTEISLFVNQHHLFSC